MDRPIGLQEQDGDRPRDLAQLIIEIHKRHDEVDAAEAGALDAAIESGRALLDAQKQVQFGQWSEWCSSNVRFSLQRIQIYMRCALYRDELEAKGVSSISEARVVLKNSGLVLPLDRKARPLVSTQSPELVKAVNERRRAGMSWNAIGTELLGYSTAGNVVRSWVDPEYRRSRRAKESEREKARRQHARTLRAAAKQVERDELARRRGGSAASAYSLVRRLLSELDRAIGETQNVEARAALREAMSRAHVAEDFIVAALKGHDRPMEYADRARRHSRPNGLGPS